MSRINLALLHRVAVTLELSTPLPPELSLILSRGFFEIEGHCFLKFYRKRVSKEHLQSMINRFYDGTGLECWVNDIDIDPHDHPDHMQIGLVFISKLIQRWKRSKLYRPAAIIMSSNETLTNIKFHLQRSDEAWFEEDLEGYGSSGICIFDV